MPEAVSAFEFEFRTLTGEALPLSRFEGKPVLIVNTASRCGFTPQYRELEGLWERYRSRGLAAGSYTHRTLPTIYLG